MNARRRLAGLTLLLTWGACLLLGSTAQAEEPAAKPAADGWRPLIEGNALTNWKSSEFGGDGKIEVKDGTLTLGVGRPITGIRWKGPDFPKFNYEISLEAQRVEGSDFFLGLTFPVKDKACTLVLGGWGGGVLGLSSIDGMDASENETSDYYPFENKHWYKARVKVTPTHVQAWVNDKKIADVDYTESTIDVRIEMELCKPLGLATYMTEGEIRNFQYRTLNEPKEEKSNP